MEAFTVFMAAKLGDAKFGIQHLTQMKNLHLFFAFYILHFTLSAQTISQKLQRAYQQFESDSQLKHALISLYVINEKTGGVVFDKNSQIGLAPASTQKIITAATAFELLGKDYRYKTVFTLQHFNSFTHRLVVYGSGDPTFGSWRFKETRDSTIFDSIINKIRSLSGSYIHDVNVSMNGDSRQIPGGWIFEDIANYYGAGSYSLNWHENQYDIDFISGEKLNDPTKIITAPQVTLWRFINEVKTGPVGSGDNAYIYFIPGDADVLIQGTIPIEAKKFTISGADPDPVTNFASSLVNYAISKGVKVDTKSVGQIPFNRELDDLLIKTGFYTHYSPPLDSIIYWFLQKSINLYGEALVKTFAYEKKGFGATDTGVIIVKDFWKQHGLDENELNIYDGSGLSPLNRVTTHAQVEILKYAKQRPWFAYFFNALPEYNNMKMKSGSISDVKGFCGYHTSGDGTQYIFSFLVNNYSGTSSGVVKKMYQVLDNLK
jgi:D-alanyl-D-alanine carboxypeptidase/D-alanyl-D-alanine-endopeptidase (penicillin-binding protein 4)